MNGLSLLLDAAAIHGREQVPRPIRVPLIAGADWVQTVPGGALWFIQTVQFTLATSAAGVNRTTGLRFSDNDGELYRQVASGLQAVSNSSVYNFSPLIGNSYAAATAGLMRCHPFPACPILGGWSIGSITDSLDAGDIFRNIILYVIEIEETPYLTELARDLRALRTAQTDAVPQLTER